MSTPATCERSSASQKVLSLPELVLPTIKDLAPRDLHSAALVCHTWSGIALDYLWETAASLAPLFNTLAPMRYSEEESNWTFVTDLSQANWSRFHIYARRIRTVEICNPDKRWSKPVSMDSVETVQASIPSGYHFPRPVCLWYDGVSHDDENSMSFTLSLRNFLSIVSTSIRDLHSFEPKFIAGGSDDAPVQELCRRFGKLEGASLESVGLSLPFYFSNSPAIPNLVKTHASTISSLDLDLFCTEHLWTAMRGLHNLKEFSIDLEFACASPSSRRDTIMALDDITSRMFPKLEVFSVALPSTDIDTEERRFEVFKCISRLTRLTSLTMGSRTPIMPYADQMRHVGQSLCRLQTLRIDAYVWRDDHIPGTSSSLVSILQSFPHIKRLETYITCDSIPDTTQTEAHSSLEILDLIGSPAPKARQEEVVGFLKSILPSTAQVVHAGEEGVYGVGAWKAAWDEVARLMDEA
ncbi:hypothetical protein M407DRAFT_20606 [Tulasnella calospora MUT 4182]|uniref:F-box domain-containing protein n=1 Tax=Tulasnella calospora MUT 4182 TaxID=1051891 RepID=A0A0C3M9J1_9AGAM|nr:hypothetical protein M407DRAFT_20606 [Tulasnella calospora MUT 4182]